MRGSTNYLLELEEESRSANDVYHNILVEYNVSPRRVWAVVEGESDPEFLDHILRELVPNHIEIAYVLAGNRYKAIRAYECFDWARFSRLRICFFLDRDFSDFHPNDLPSAENVYVTDGYSIENVLACDLTLANIAVDIFGIRGLTGEQHYKLGKDLARIVNQICRMLMPVTAQMLSWKLKGLRPVYRDFSVTRFITIDATTASVGDENFILTTMEKKCKAPRCAPNDLAQLKAILRRKKNHARILRGKQVSEVCALVLSRPATIRAFSSSARRQPHLQVYAKNMCFIAMRRVHVPRSLNRFITRTFLRYSNGLSATDASCPSERPTG